MVVSIAKSIVMALLLSMMSFSCLSQGKIVLTLEFNDLRGSAFINDTIALGPANGFRFSPGIGYMHGFNLKNNWDIEAGVIFSYFHEQFFIRNLVLDLTLPGFTTDFFRFRFPIKMAYTFNRVKSGIALLPTLNLDPNEDFPNLSWMTLNQSFNHFTFGLLFEVEFLLSRSLRCSFYYDTYLTSQYSINGSDLRERGFGLGIGYIVIGKKAR